MNYFVTNYNLEKLFLFLDENIPLYGAALRHFYQNTYLTDFALKADIFPAKEAKILAICQKVFKGIANINQDFYINKAKEETKKWVNKIVPPAYHVDKDCKRLNDDFNNYPIPMSCQAHRAEEYRQYFIQHKDNYGYSANEFESKSFVHKLKMQFNLEEDIETLLEEYFTPYIAKNSGSQEQNYELSREEIVEKIAEFRQLMAKTGYSSRYISTIGTVLHNNKDLSEKERENLKEIYKQRKIIFYSLLSYYVFSLKEQGLDVSKEFMELLGFKPCGHCCKGKVYG